MAPGAGSSLETAVREDREVAKTDQFPRASDRPSVRFFVRIDPNNA